MALDLGELVGRIALDDRDFVGTLRTAERGMTRLESVTRGALGDVEQGFAEAGAGANRQMAQAMGRLESTAADGGRSAGEAAARGMTGGLGRVEAEAAQAGQEAGERLARAIAGALREHGHQVEAAARRVGDDAGEGAGHGAEQGSTRRVSGLGGKLAGLLGKAKGPFMAAGATLGGVLMVGIHGAIEKQDAMGRLKAQVGAFGPEADRLGKAAGHLFSRGYGESMGEVTEAIGAVVSSVDGMRSASTADVEAMAAKVSDLASVFDLDVGRAAQIAGQLVKSGLVDTASQGLDLLTASMQRVPAAVREDVVDALDEYSPFLTQIGIKGKQAFNLLVQSAEKGAFGLDKTGDALKEFTLRATDMSAGSKAAYDAIGLSQKQMAADLLAGGKRGEQAFQKIVTGLRNIKDPVKQSQAAIALFGTPLEDLSTKDIPKFLATLDLTKDRLGNTAGAADRMGKSLHDTASGNLTRFQRTMQTKLVDFLGGHVVPGLTTFGGKANKALHKWLDDNQGTVDDVKAVWSKFSDKVGDAVGGVQKWLDKNHAKVEEWSNKVGGAISTVAGIISAGLDIASALARIFGPTGLKIVSVFIDTVIGYWSGMFTMIKGYLDIFAGILTGDWGRVWKGIQEVFSGALQSVGSILRGSLAPLLGLWDWLWGGVKRGAQSAWSWVVGKVQGGVQGVSSAVGWLASLPGRVTGWFRQLGDGAVREASGMVSWMRGLPGRMLSALGSLGSLLYGAGRNVITGLINGIVSKLGDVGSAMGSIASKIRGYLPFSPAKEGPLSGSGNPQASGAKIGAMLATGIRGSRGRVAAAWSDTLTLSSGKHISAVLTGSRRAAAPAAPGGGAGSFTGATTTRVIIDLRGVPAELKRWIRQTVRVEGRGNVQIAFGTNKGR